MTFWTFARNPGQVLDQLKIGTVIKVGRRGALIATITGVHSSDLPAWTVTQCKRAARLRLVMRDSDGIAVTRDGMIEAEIRPVRA